MILATLPAKNPKTTRHGRLVVVSQDHLRAVYPGGDLPQTMLQAVETWNESHNKLADLFRLLNEGGATGSFAIDLGDCLAPLPNAPGFYDGSAFLSHVVRARRARGDNMPESARLTPLMYQGVSDNLLGGTTPLSIMDPAYGGDFEGEFAAITTDVPRGVSADKASGYIALMTLFNDITYREIVKTEIETKFGFLQSKPNSSFAPLALTLNELGGAWRDERVHLNMRVILNGRNFGNPHGREMNFTFGQLIAHAARTRPLSAGSIVGTGTVSNEDKAAGFACLTEKRFQEILDDGKPSTPWLKVGDRVQIDALIGESSLFGPIDQTVAL